MDFMTHNHVFFTHFVYVVNSERIEPFEILVIGEDTLEWNIGLQNSVEEESVTYSLHADVTGFYTPREFIERAKENCAEFFGEFNFTVTSEEFLIRWVDNLLDIKNSVPFTAPRNYANIRCVNHISPGSGNNCIFRHSSRYRDYRPHYIYPQQAHVVTIPFQPGQERVFSMTQVLASGKQWYEGIDKSLIYCPVLTESAAYWDSFGALTVITSPPSGEHEMVLSEGFIFYDGIYALHLDEAPDENLFVGFLVHDLREAERSRGLWIFMATAIIGIFWPLILAIVLLIIYLKVNYGRKRRQDNPRL